MGKNDSPSAIKIKLASSPSRNSSITTLFPADPNSLPDSMSVTVFSASGKFSAMTTPLPAANPSALITVGNLEFFKYSIADVNSVKVSYSAVGILCLFKKSFVKLFDPSS